MNGFMQWFKASSKMKRWIFLILIGILLACYGIAEIIVLKEMTFSEVGKIVGIFVLGFLAIVTGLVFLNKRTLEVLVESTDERMENKQNVNVKSLIFNKTVYDQGPNIVVIGGGTGLNTVLAGLKKYTNNVTAIVTVSDYGEEATNSRKELNMLPLEDIKESMIALANKEEEMNSLMNYEFRKGKLRGLSFSDIYFSAMKEISGDFTQSIMKSNEVLNIVGKVLPATLEEMNIEAELANGYVVKEKKRIPEMVYDKVTKINRIYLNPANCKPAPGVIEAIKEADCIIIGPGSLYTNVIPNLLVNGVAKTIKESIAMKIYISNIMTEPGQTDNYTVTDHINAIIDHCGKGIIDYCIYDTGEIIPEFIKKYNIEGQDLVEQDIDKISGIKFLQKNLSMVSEGFIRHDPNLVASSIIELICDDLRYQDKQNDPQYLMLNNKLRHDKRIDRIKRQMEKQEKKKEKKGENSNQEEKKKGKSKFSNKYSDRINSIREADEKTKIKEEKRKKANKKTVHKEEKIQNTEKKEKIEESNKNEKTINTKPKSARGRKRKTPQQIREEMIQQADNSNITKIEDEVEVKEK